MTAADTHSPMVGRAALATFALVVALATCSAAAPAPGLIVGVSDDYLQTEPGRATAAIREVGFGAVRLTLRWAAGRVQLSGSDAAGLADAVRAASGLRIVVVSYSRTEMPRTTEERENYCSYLRSIVTRYPQIRDVVVWNEPNKSTFWRPQFEPDGSSAAPRDYALLLERCYSMLHDARSDVNVIHAGLSSTGNDRPNAASNVSHSPGNFIRREGEAVRTLLAGRRLFDTFAVHPYGEDSSEPPWKRHDASSTIAIGDWEKLVRALRDAFGGTAQPTPAGRTARSAEADNSLPIWFLEIGFQTKPDAAKTGLYTGTENDPGALPAAPGAARAVIPRTAESGVTQAGQLRDAIRRAYCLPYVEAFFNFLLRDERELNHWQSAPFWVDWSPKPSVAALRQVIAEVEGHGVDCDSLAGGPVQAFVEQAGVEVERVLWPKAGSFNWKNDLWRFRIQTGEDAAYAARLVRLDRTGQAPSGTPVLSAVGELRKLYLTIVRFPERRLEPGRYRMEIVLTSKESSARETTLRGPAFEVRRPAR